MITVKQILEQYNIVSDKATDEEIKLAALSDAGIFESSKIPMIKRSLNKNINEMTEAERKTLKSLLESFMNHVIINENKSMSYPSDKDMPVVIILKRKAIRVFPDNQKIGLYYSQALDRYISIPFGPNVKDLSPQLNEESEFQKRQREKAEKKKENTEKGRRIRSLTLQPKEKSDPAAKLTTSVPSVAKKETETLGKKPTPWGNREVIAITPEMREKAARKSFEGGNLAAQIGGRLGLAAAKMAEKTPLRSKTKVMYGQPIKESFKNNIKVIREKREYGKADAALDAASFLPGPAGTAASLASAGMSLSRGDYTGAALDVAGALPGVGYLAKGAKVAKTATQAGKAADAIKAARIEKAKDPALLKARYERRFGTKTQRIARGAGKVAKGAALGAAALGAAALGAAGGDDIKKPTSGDYGFSKTAGAQVSTAPSQTLSSGGLVAAQQQARLYQNIPGQPRQNVYESIKQITDNNIPSHTIQIGEETITINKSIAKRIIKLHESLNRSNKQKLERMLNEDITSLTKVINFAIKQ